MTQRNEAIDVIRGLSIIFVILMHCSVHLPSSEIFPHNLNNIILGSGYYGVIMFFVVSGYLITRSILNKWGSLANVSPLSFYKMRFARIMPSLLALLLILSLLNLIQAPIFTLTNTTLSQALFAALTFRINVQRAHVGYLSAPWDTLWSLSVEEVFYLFFPIVCLFLKKQRYLIIFLFFFIVAGPFARTLGDNESWKDYGYLSCMDGIAFGVLAAITSLTVKKHLMIFSAILGAGLVSLVFIFRKLTFILGLTHWNIQVSLLELGIALLLIALSQYQNKPKGTSILRWFGRNSYEIYLTHSIVIIGFMYFFKDSIHHVFLYLPVVLICGVVGHGVAKYFSEPLNHRIRSWTHYTKGNLVLKKFVSDSLSKYTRNPKYKSLGEKY